MQCSMVKKSKGSHGSKAAFVRANPTVKAPDLVALAKKQGLTLTVGHIYNIRASDKAKPKANPASPAPAPVETGSRPASSGGDLTRMDAQLRSLILELGLYRAERVFAELRSSLSRIA